MSSTVQGMPRVIRDRALTTGFTKASPVVMPDKMPTTTLNLVLKRGERAIVQVCVCVCVFVCARVCVTPINRNTKFKVYEDICDLTRP